MKTHWLLSLSLLFSLHLAAQEISLFNGRDLNGWDGLKGYWSVKDGAITGQMKPGDKLDRNTFLVWKGTVTDFDFSCRFKLVPENPDQKCNSGIQFRANMTDASGYGIKGYQAELDPGSLRGRGWPPMSNISGCLLDDPPGILIAAVGQKVVARGGTVPGNNSVAPSDVVGTLPANPAYKDRDWNDIRIVAFGNHFEIYLNGQQTIDAIDNGTRFRSGMLGLQLHKGGGAKTVQFKDLKLRVLSGAPPTMAATTVPLPVSSAPPMVTPAAGPSATVYKPDQSQIEILKLQTLNIAAWITAPLERAVPETIWENTIFLREALLDELAQKPVASKETYALANRLCSVLVANLEERKTTSARAGGDAVLHPTSNLTQQQRDHLTWPQYFLERDERAERQDRADKAPRFQNGQVAVLWAQRTQQMRTDITGLYNSFRTALRESPKAP